MHVAWTVASTCGRPYVSTASAAPVAAAAAMPARPVATATSAAPSCPVRSNSAAMVIAPTGTSVTAGWTGCPNQVPFSRFLSGLPRREHVAQRVLRLLAERLRPARLALDQPVDLAVHACPPLVVRRRQHRSSRGPVDVRYAPDALQFADDRPRDRSLPAALVGGLVEQPAVGLAQGVDLVASPAAPPSLSGSSATRRPLRATPLGEDLGDRQDAGGQVGRRALERVEQQAVQAPSGRAARPSAPPELTVEPAIGTLDEQP